MWNRIKRIFKMALLLPVLVALAKGKNVQDPDPELLTTEYSDEAMAGLSDLAYGETPTLPKVDLPGISGQESILLNWGMSLIEKMMSGQMPEAFTLGMDKIKSVLAGEYDPTKGDYYKGLKQEAETLTEEGIGGIRQAGQLGGMLYSEPRMAEESRLSGKIGTGLLQTLGGLYESNINREVGMIPQLLGYSAQEAGMPLAAMSGISNLAPLAGKSGDIARQEAFTNWGVDTKQALFPYEYKAPIMESLANWGTWSQPTTHYEPGLLDYALPIGGAIFGK